MDHLYFVVHTHWDREWYQPFQQMRARLVAMADRMLPAVESGKIPHFHFDGQTIALEDYLEVRPGNARRLAALVKAGKIAIGPWYVLADSFLVSGESLVRNLEIGMAVARRFGRPLDLGYLPDQFGHIAQLPQILAGFGFKTAVLWRGVPAAITRNRFLWEALDGSRVFTVYLPFGYSNGANLPLESADALLLRAREIASRERGFAGGGPILVMNGTDHTEPDPRLIDRIAEANGKDGFSFEAGTLEGYIKRLSEVPAEGAPIHRGELRSPARVHLLPSVTSARTWIKQQDFANCAALERYAGPMAALANGRGRGDGLADFLDLAWRIELQNHPHDSICGCSVDQVHTDMRYRFDQAAMIAESVVRAASRDLLEAAAGAEPAIAVFNPTFTREAAVSGEVELADPEANHAAVAQDGTRTPVAIEVARGERAFEAELPAAEFKAIVAGLSSPQVFGRTVNHWALRDAGDNRFELELSLSRAAMTDIDLTAFRDEIRNRVPDAASVKIRASNAARCTVSFAAAGLEQTGFSFYRLLRDDSPRDASSAHDSIANEFYEVGIGRWGLAIRDLAAGETAELYFEDEGDRGDEYNFDPVPGSEPVFAPESIALESVEDGPARKRLRLRLAFNVSERLSDDRASWSAQRAELKIVLTATLFPGMRRVDFVAEVLNEARDHRLRVALATPIRADHSISDTSFGVVRRPLISPEPRGVEAIYPTVPHRTVTAIEGPEFSAAMMSRGIYEIEARGEPRGTTLLLTLLRCVGWLSRSDLAMRDGGAGPELETVGAQELGAHRFEFAITTYAGGYREADLMGRAAAYAYPPRLFAAGATAAAPFIARCDNPRVLFSTARPERRKGAYIVRVYSASPQPESVRLEFARGHSASVIDLRGRKIGSAEVRRRASALEMNLKPFEIVTVRVGGAKIFSSAGQNSLLE